MIDIARWRDDPRLARVESQGRASADLSILTNLTSGYGFAWERRRALISGSGLATSLGWQHLTADRARAAFD